MMANTQTRFDPAVHLTKQGWKGKGTALKEGHATRPVPVVQKKSLSGIGKDRDEAVPFWDQIFASTAANLFSPSPTASGSNSPKSTWTTLNASNAGKGPVLVAARKPAVSAGVKVGRETARRGLYSRFLRGKVLGDEEAEAVMEVLAGPSGLVGEVGITPDGEQSEAREDKRVRREEKVRRREEKEVRRVEREMKKVEKAKRVTKVETVDKGPRLGGQEVLSDGVLCGEPDVAVDGDTRRTKRRRKVEGVERKVMVG